MNTHVSTTHREYLEQIMRICYESSNYDRRVQTVHNLSMIALGLTESQRAERHIKAAMRSEAYKEQKRTEGRSVAKKQLIKEIEEESGMPRVKCKSLVEDVVA